MATSRIIRIKSPTGVRLSDERLPPCPPVSRPQRADVGYPESRKRMLNGHLVSVANGIDEAIVGARVELHAVAPLCDVAPNLSIAVLTNLRTALLRGPAVVDLYRHAGYVVDAPQISIADIALLHSVPGYELVARAARLQPDTAFRQMLCNYPDILRPLLCYYHPCSFRSECVAVSVSDRDGAFRFPVLETEKADEQPGYFFIVRRQFSSNLFVTLYEPSPSTWHTYWRHFDEEPIRLSTRHPLASRAPSVAWA